MLKRFSSLLSKFILVALIPSAVLAQGKSDFSQPMEVESSQEELDIKNNRLVLTDNVIIRQGTLLIRADRLEASASENAEQADTFVAEGSPATYSQTLDDGNQINAEANKITYFQGEQRLELSGNARISQGSSSSSGELITYDLDEQTVTATSSGEENSRVITIFTPKPKTDSDKNNNENP
ncbi:lipopolysaccharide transport periplasmic protein LptA [Idiomarina ramblicola]|uniref:Lipopolysaccharide export system protein LptA n=1 Tax=Idiomarina ramblicola TaxID=263724 RepID=A0A432Z222_9GAMM|nr:lipopolysaccharide transport periplasmic protein LptA [Idiomarina ramblicola]RUO71925.1 lipopolysaccharide transport periplasmic protein LptA [Idiomarina ramblicola]